MEKIRVIQVTLFVSFLIILYFLLPYILPLLGVKSYVILTHSMAHVQENQAFFESFWENLGVDPENLPLRYGFVQGDLMIISPSENYSLGDVVVLRIPQSKTLSSHRIFKINSTHFRDIGDRCINETNLRQVELGVKGVTIAANEGEEDLKKGYEKVYEGPYYEISSHYWIPLYYIEGKAVMLLPKAGMLHLLFKGPGEIYSPH
jgi:hypothetical protein